MPERSGETASWEVEPPVPLGRPARLLIPAFRGGQLLAVRSIPLCKAWSDEGCDGPLFLPGSIVEADPGAGVGLHDVPTPFRAGVLDPGDGGVVFAVRSPVAAAVLNWRGVRACAFSSPSGTLGAPDALHQLVDLGAITPGSTPRSARRGSLVLMDRPGKELSRAGAGLLRGLFAEVIEVQDSNADGFARGVADRNAAKEGALPDRLLRWARREGKSSDVAARPLPPKRTSQLPLSGRGFLDLNDIARSPGPAVDWVLPGLAAAGTVTDLIGESKAGKSTLILEAVRALVEGRDFLGEPCGPSAVVIVSEQTEASLKATLDQMSWDTAGVRVITADVHGAGPFDETLARVREEVKATGARLAVFDTLPSVAGMGEELSSAGPVREAFRKVRTVCSLGAAVVVSRHTTKESSGGHNVPVNRAGVGSYAFAGEADHIVLYSLVPGADELRRIRTRGRLSANDEYCVAWTGTGVEKRPCPSGGGEGPPGKREATAAAQEDAVLAALARARGGPLGLKEVVAALRARPQITLKEKAAQTTLERLVGKDEVERAKSGKKYLYSLRLRRE